MEPNHAAEGAVMCTRPRAGCFTALLEGPAGPAGPGSSGHAQSGFPKKEASQPSLELLKVFQALQSVGF
jgi:hypothetical protein